jgi:hypothetical protein
MRAGTLCATDDEEEPRASPDRFAGTHQRSPLGSRIRRARPSVADPVREENRDATIQSFDPISDLIPA